MVSEDLEVIAEQYYEQLWQEYYEPVVVDNDDLEDELYQIYKEG